MIQDHDERDDELPPPFGDDTRDDKDEGSSFAGKVIPDLFRRALMTGIGTVFMTEDGIRNALGDLKMPKEAMTYVVNQADKTKRELIATLARELRAFLDGLELSELMQRSLVGTTFEIHTTIKVTRDDDDGKNKVTVTERSSGIKRESKAKKKKGKKKAKKKASKQASKEAEGGAEQG